MDDNQEITMACYMLAKALGIEPEAIMVAGREIDGGYELRVVIMASDETEMTDSEKEMEIKVNDLFS